MSETRATSSEISLRQAAKFRGYVRRYPSNTHRATAPLWTVWRRWSSAHPCGDRCRDLRGCAPVVDRLGLVGARRQRCCLYPETYGPERKAARRRTGYSRNAINSGVSDLSRSSVQLCAHVPGAWSPADRSLEPLEIDTGLHITIMYPALALSSPAAASCSAPAESDCVAFPLVPAGKDGSTHQFATLLFRQISPASFAALFSALPTEGHRVRILLSLRHGATLPYQPFWKCLLTYTRAI